MATKLLLLAALLAAVAATDFSNANTWRGDNHKPVFQNCSALSFSLDEETAVGQFVGRVQAFDEDPPDRGGFVTYTILHGEREKTKFSIDSVTGEIRSKYIFDRDEPARETHAFVTIQAMDNGRPPLIDICLIKVVINDVNDNSPMFDASKYHEFIPQDTKTGTQVMRVSASDLDSGINSDITYSMSDDDSEYKGYFHIDAKSGLINLSKNLTALRGKDMTLRVSATDSGNTTVVASTQVRFTVIDSKKKTPEFVRYPTEPIKIKEDFNDYAKPIAVLSARSNLNDDDDLIFEFWSGRTEMTNQGNSFLIQSNHGIANITLGKPLDYEKTTRYHLTVAVKNTDELTATIKIEVEVEDVNDNIPAFLNIASGNVLENEPIGTTVMSVRAFDMDGTSENNQVTYSISSPTDIFDMDSKTGLITTKVMLDREKTDLYIVKVKAQDNSPSALPGKNGPNEVENAFTVKVEDKNDNPPVFENDTYTADISEASAINEKVVEVRANDVDTASRITYSIVSGNTNDSFRIEESTGLIRVKSPLDYEKIKSYSMQVRAFDEYFEAFATVRVDVLNVNDNPPAFRPHIGNITNVVENTIPPDCIIIVQAYDPDLDDQTGPQNIVYSIKTEQADFMSVDANGCVRLTKPLDRDPPNGNAVVQVHVQANDDNGSISSLAGLTEIFIILIDANDNAPFLKTVETIWSENREPGKIIQLEASDYDEGINAEIDSYEIADNASERIKKCFRIEDDSLVALVEFDREKQKEYIIPIKITDRGSPKQTGYSDFRVIIGDENDNPMGPGESEIFVYKFEFLSKDIRLGRVYVEDLDDWDTQDKEFVLETNTDDFYLNSNDKSYVYMKSSTPKGFYSLHFKVTESSIYFDTHSVPAVLNVTVKEIPKEAVDSSGSIRFAGITAEDFIRGTSKKAKLHSYLSKVLNTSMDNVDVFNVQHSPVNAPSTEFLDVRFSAHGSPYYPPERLNWEAERQAAEMNRVVGRVAMIPVSECLNESRCASSCFNELVIDNDEPAIVMTNKTTFVGIKAFVNPRCECRSAQLPLTCLHGGTYSDGSCSCPAGYDGPRCEIFDIGFDGKGYALYKSFQACEKLELSVEITTKQSDGLIYFNGPGYVRPETPVQDFIALELRNGYPTLLFDYGSGTQKAIFNNKKLSDGARHTVTVILKEQEIELIVDNCKKSECILLRSPVGKNRLLNVNGPLQVGGTYSSFSEMGSRHHWNHVPSSKGFVGCIRNFTVNGEVYDLGHPGHALKHNPGCNTSTAVAVSFSVDTDFLVAVLICFAILIILLLAVVVHRRHQENWNEKDIDDIRENIINYEDEGGGEVDTGYDLNVLRQDLELEKQKSPYGHAEPVPDMNGFLEARKENCDKDPETMLDDVRHYAYEGDGNTSGSSLSSLASCTDEGDLKFNHLSNFGARFRKLADMYGEDPSDDDSQEGGEESWC